VVRFFHKQGFALKTPQPWSDKQDEQTREKFLEELKKLMAQPDVDIWFVDESGFEGDPGPESAGIRREEKPVLIKMAVIYA
jgi:putative transposase